MGLTKPISTTPDAAQVLEAHAAAYAQCEPWLATLEQGVVELHGARDSLTSVSKHDRAVYLSEWRTNLEHFLEAARAFASSVEQALQALPTEVGAGLVTEQTSQAK